MDQIANNLLETTSALSVGTRLQHAGLTKGYSLEDLAIVTPRFPVKPLGKLGIAAIKPEPSGGRQRGQPRS